MLWQPYILKNVVLWLHDVLKEADGKANLFKLISCHISESSLTRKAPYTTKAEFANTVDPDETAQYEPSHLDLQCLSSGLLSFNIIQFILKVFRNFADIILSSAFLRFTG